MAEKKMPLSTKKERKREEDAPPPTEPRAVTLAPVAWGGNWASKITESAIDSSPMKAIAEMFPLVSLEVISAVLGMHSYNVRETVEYFLAQAVEEEIGLGRALLMHTSSSNNNNNNNLLCSVPPDAFFLICDFLDWCHLPILSRVSRECRKLTVRSDVRQLNCTRFRNWKDWRLLGLMSACKNLTSLSCRKCSSFTSFFNIPSVAPRLTSLNLAECPVTARDLQHLLTFLPELVSLDLSNGPVCDDGLEVIGIKGRKLQRLILVACKSITCAAVGILISRMPQLKELDLRATSITNASTVFQAPSGLESLNCSQCSRLTMMVVEVPLDHFSLSSMPHLVSLTLRGRIGSLNASSCRNLRHLTIEDAGCLRELNLSGCPLLKDLVLKNPDRDPWELVNLNIFQCRSLSPETLCHMFELVGPSLEVLNGGGLIQLDDDTLDSIVNCCVRLKWLELPVPKRGLSTFSVQTAQQVVEARQRAAQEEEEEEEGKLSTAFSPSRVMSPRGTRTPVRTRSTNFYSPSFTSTPAAFSSPTSSSFTSPSASFSSPLFSSSSSPSSPGLFSSSSPLLPAPSSSVLFSSPCSSSSSSPSSSTTVLLTASSSINSPSSAIVAASDATSTATSTSPTESSAGEVNPLTDDLEVSSPASPSPSPTLSATTASSLTSSSTSLVTSDSPSLTPSSRTTTVATSSSPPRQTRRAERLETVRIVMGPSRSPSLSPPPHNRQSRSPLRAAQNRQQALQPSPDNNNHHHNQGAKEEHKQEFKQKQQQQQQSAWARKTQQRRLNRLQKKLHFDQHRSWVTPGKKSRSGAVFLKIPPVRVNNALSHAFA